MCCWINHRSLFPQRWDFGDFSQSLSQRSDAVCCLEQYSLIHSNSDCFFPSSIDPSATFSLPHPPSSLSIPHAASICPLPPLFCSLPPTVGDEKQSWINIEMSLLSNVWRNWRKYAWSVGKAHFTIINLSTTTTNNTFLEAFPVGTNEALTLRPRKY